MAVCQRVKQEIRAHIKETSVSPFMKKLAAMENQLRWRLLQCALEFPVPPGLKICYGTAGFRAEGSILESTVCRTGILAALRSLKMGGAAVGLMITASHNPIADNGVKVADPSGNMMTQKWEPFADALANASSPDDLLRVVLDFVEQEKISFSLEERSEVILARDTRPSGDFLLEAAKKGIASVIGAVAIDLGILTTPQLHWIVRRKNQGKEASEKDYFRQLSDSFRRLIGLTPESTPESAYDPRVIVDGANGVGGEKLLELMKLLPPEMEIHLRNSGKKGEGAVNESVGADFVQKEKKLPRGFSPAEAGARCTSFDGDADRIVYFQIKGEDEGKNIDLIDGDKILSLFALFIKEQLSKLEESRPPGNERKLGVVQTAYANGASTEFLKSMGIQVSFTPRGVKYLHEKAAQYDVGIYFEANGHGTVLFSDKFLQELEELTFRPEGGSRKAALTLWEVSRLVNQAVGDAFSGFLLVEAILRRKGWSTKEWSALYEDLPSRQLKVKVADRSVVSTTDEETRVVNPPGLQEAIDAETAKYAKGRCFIRPSGTEDVVRVYAEAATSAGAESLAAGVVLEVTRFLGV